MRRLFNFFGLGLLLTGLMSCAPQTDMLRPTPRKTDPLALEAQIPLDSKITKGRLDNGLTYYIRSNQNRRNAPNCAGGQRRIGTGKQRSTGPGALYGTHGL
jgi:hypothetical protein